MEFFNISSLPVWSEGNHSNIPFFQLKQGDFLSTDKQAHTLKKDGNKKQVWFKIIQ